MAGTLPIELVDETRRTLDHVVHLNLPAPAWPAVGATLHRIDAAAEAGDAVTLGVELATLRDMGLGSRGPQASPASLRPADYGPPPPMAAQARAVDRIHPLPGVPVQRRSSVRWIVAAVVAVVVLIGIGAVWVMFGPSDTRTGSPAPTFTQTPEPLPPATQTPEPLPTSPDASEPPPTPDTPTPTGVETAPSSTNPPPQPSDSGGAGFAIAISIAGAFVLASAALIAITMHRRGSRPSRAYRPASVERLVDPPPRPPPLPAPHEIVELVNRTVLTLAAHGGRP